MKRTVTLLIVLIMITALLTGCGHKHDTGNWSVDLERHWKTCSECGKETKKGKHELDSMGVCEKCGAEFSTFDDGSTFITTYNEQGDYNGMYTYSPDGSLKLDMYSEYEYAEDGTRLSSKTYISGQLTEENIYRPNPDDPENPMVAESTSHYSDGAREHKVFDEMGNLTSSVYYEADGTVSSDESFEHVYDEKGQFLNIKMYMDGILFCENDYDYRDDGTTYICKVVYYNEDGTVDTENYYNEDGSEK